MAATGAGRLRQRAEFRMVELVRPGGWWPNPHSLEQCFGLLRAALAAGEGAHLPPPEPPPEPGRRRRRPAARGPSLVDRLTPGGGWNHGSEVPVRSLAGLREVFQHLVLGRMDGPLDAWRESAGLGVGGTFRASFPHHRPFEGTPLGDGPALSEEGVRKALDRLLGGLRGRALAVSPNPCHLKARELGDVEVRVSATGFRIVAEYRLEGSSWTLGLARGGADEPFAAVLGRAVARLDLLLDEGGLGPARLCAALNAAEATAPADPHGTHRWILGRRPIQRTSFDEGPQPRFLVVPKVGYGRGCASIADTPSGRILSRDPSYDWPRVKALAAILEDRFPRGSAAPTRDEVAAIREAETEAVRPSYDAEGRHLFDRDGKPLSAEALAKAYAPPPDSEMDPEVVL